MPKTYEPKEYVSTEGHLIRILLRALAQCNANLESIVKDGLEGTRDYQKVLKAYRIDHNKALIAYVKKQQRKIK